MAKQRSILVVDDDAELRELLQQFFQQHDFACSMASCGKELFQTLKEKSIDLVVLDLMLAREDGLELCKKIRKESTVAVIMLTAMKEDSERILGLEYGADDYITKPFNNRELLARVNAVLRRVCPEASSNPIYRFCGFTLDTNKRELVDVDNNEITITSGLYELLLAFLERPQRVLSRDQLLDITRGLQCDPNDRSIDIQLSRLRNKLKATSEVPNILKTIRNEGYMLTCAVEKSQ